jgi:spore coat polysaccharide biosynthesis protein SpsF
LNDVLKRYEMATAGLPDDCLVVRMTGDNIVPDGQLVEELVTAFADSGVEYLCHSSPQSRLPYGLGAEAFLVSTLRKANAAATSRYDREHVGPWISRNCRAAIHVPRTLGTRDFGHLRCTIDDEEDYLRVCRLFQGVEDPVRIAWFDLAQKLATLPGEPTFRVPYRVFSGRVHSELVLGTAQLGMEYGIVNRAGRPTRSLATRIARSAVAHGVTFIDTARAYGDAEEILGGALAGAWRSRVEVVTKLDPLTSVPHNAEPSVVRSAIDDSVNRSCEALGVPQLSTLLLHRWRHYHSWGGSCWRRLLELHDQGRIATLGASVYEPGEALAALEDPAIQHLQLPMNVVDWRWRAAAVDRVLASRPDVIVHARSALLQGLLARPGESWPLSSSYDASRCTRQLSELAARFGRESVADLCLAYVRSQSWVTATVVGCETFEQLEENLRLFRLPHLTPEQCAELEESLPVAPEELLDASRWKLVHEQSPS